MQGMHLSRARALHTNLQRSLLALSCLHGRGVCLGSLQLTLRTRVYACVCACMCVASVQGASH